jgi:hypothetical protein
MVGCNYGKEELMIYLLSRVVKYMTLTALLAGVLAIVAGAAAFVITFVVLIMLLMITDAILESSFAGFKSLLTYGSLDRAEVAFYSRFGKVVKRYNNLRP